ncbi:ElaA protein [Mesonia hippocampi]|uniref:ElaA protein n=1 Tax=Mesonia hippocampi TaxID=1628250 RepID=A0A840ENA3_9FLAO|nr:GNAT family N-acetyltransferase [Mesonia hippocampi]MBB4118450.1 ElaA protein [Mesonia hippocampi]
MELSFQIKTFQELTTTSLYEVLQLRAKVFVVEQNCNYQDVDGLDTKALHVLGYIDNHLIAYARCFAPGEYFPQAAIGRVLVEKNYRKENYGHRLLEETIKVIGTYYNTTSIKISAQEYLLKFYQQHGFKAIGDTYLEDNIPHRAMLKA